MRRVLSLFIFIFLTFPLFAAEDWFVLKDNISSNQILKELLSPKGKISYCIDGSQTQIVPDIEKTFQLWFDNVLSYRNIYPDFDNTFKEILPILERKNKMSVQQCATPLKRTGLLGQKINNFDSQRIGYKLAAQKPLLRINFCYRQECLAENVGGACERENKPERNIFIAKDTDNLIVSLAHELGHTLGIADVLYAKDTQAENLGYFTTDTIMTNLPGFTCDDADGIVAILYMALKKPKTFYSFCGTRFFENGQAQSLNLLERTFDKDYKKYKKLENLNRLNDKGIKDLAFDYYTRNLEYKLKQNPDNIKNPKNLL